MLNTFIIALALAFIIEGLFPALFPNRWQAYVQKLAKENPSTIRTMGTIIILMGCLLLWLAI
jgi:uncharacterized protein YjeT (DUF2065 family)